MIKMPTALARSFTNIFVVLFALMQRSNAEEGPALKTLLTEDSLQIRVVIPGVCRAGDMNAVAQEMMFSDKGREAKILLSLTSLDGSEEYVSEILEDFRQKEFLEDPVGFLSSLANTERNVELKIKRPSQRKVFTVTVCKDTKGRHSCKQDSETGYRDIMEILRAYTDPKPGFISEDSVYFYQLLTIDPSGVALAREPLYSDKGFKEFAAENSFDRANKDIQLARLRKIYSLPIAAEGDRLVIKLPLYDSKRCG